MPNVTSAEGDRPKPKVSFVVSNHLRTAELARFVSASGLHAGRDNGHSCREEENPRDYYSVGLYLPIPRPHRKLLWFAACQEWGWIGTIYTSSKERGANNKNWVMEIFGRENVDRLKALAERVAVEFGVSVHVRLEHDITYWQCENANHRWMFLT